MKPIDAFKHYHYAVTRHAANTWNTFTTALSFLTIFRLPRISSQPFSSDELAASFSFFPLVGCILGIWCCACALILSSRMPSLLLAALITAFLALLTRGLHLDGLADFADGAGGGYTCQRRLEIMKDSRTGAFGALALVLAIVLKVAALQPIIQSHSWSNILVVPMLARLAMVLSAYRSTYARPEGGLGKPFLDGISLHHVLTAVIISAVLSILLTHTHAPLFAAIAILSAVAFRTIANRILGGITGDVLGAVNELTEICLFAFSACLVNT